MLTWRTVNSGNASDFVVPPNQPKFSIPINKVSITTTKNPAVVKIVLTIAGVRMFSSFFLGGTRMTLSRGGSLHRAIDANVSMMTLIHNNCNTVNGGFTPKNGPRNAITSALTLIVNWN